MGKSAGSPPPAPSASETATAQAQANTSTAAAQAALNYVNQNTPYGSTSYQQTGSYTTPEGQTVPTYTQNTSLSPMGQSILGGQQQVTNSLIPTAEQLAQQAAGTTTKPLTLNAADQAYLDQGPQQLNDAATNALYNKQKSFLDPQWDQQAQQLQDQLSRQGIPVGSEAYNNALKQLNNSRTQAYDAASNGAIAGGSQAAANLFGLAQAGQNQNLSTQQIMQQNPLALLSQISGATPATPQQPIATPSQTGVGATDVTGATALQNNAAMQAYQAQVAQANAGNGATAGVVGALATVAAAY